MIKLLVLLQKRAELSWEEFHRYWGEEHVPIVRGIPGLRGYVQNHATDPRTATFAVSEFYFDDLAALQRAFESREGQATLEDATRFSDPEQLQMVVVEEVRIV